MNRLYWTRQFKKDVKKQNNSNKDIQKLKDLLKIIHENKIIPQQYKAHKLFGLWKDHRECHIESDWLLIWKKEGNNVYLIRTGTHSELFK